MKKFFIIVLLVSLGFFLKPAPASAHVLKTDGSIGTILHIEPDDEPIVGEQSSFFFEFKDTQNKFDPKKCTCTFTILENGSEIFSQPLFQNSSSPSLDNASVFYTFPKKDVYQVKVTGAPENPSAFQKFTLTYDIRVARESSGSNTSLGLTSPFIIYILIVLVVGGFSAYQFRKNLSSKQNLEGGEQNEKNSSKRS